NAQIAVIWNLEAIGTAATTDTKPRSADEQRAWLAAHTDDYPALVAAVDDDVVAFGGLAPYRAKPSYARTVEDSVYVKGGWRGKAWPGRDELGGLGGHFGAPQPVGKLRGCLLTRGCPPPCARSVIATSACSGSASSSR